MPDPSLPPPDKKVTLKDVARALGISHVAVSLALRNSTQIPPARRAEVRAMADRMGYRPNAMGAGLAQYRQNVRVHPVSSSIAWINRWREPGRLRSYREFELYWQGARETAERLGYRLEEFVCDKNLTLRRVADMLRARNVRGVLIPPHGGPAGCGGPEAWRIDWRPFAVVKFGYSTPAPAAPIVTSNQVANVALALDRLRAKGYRRVGFATKIDQTTRHLCGYAGAQAKWSPAERVAPFLVKGDDDEKNRRAFFRWLKISRPDALVTDMGEIHGWLDLAGWRVPEDLGLAALSILDGGVDAGIDQQSWHIGKAAAEIVISRIQHQDFGETPVGREILVDGLWVDGSTLSG